MQVTGEHLTEGMDWSVKPEMRTARRALSSVLTLRGRNSESVDTTAFRDPALYADWALDPLLIRSHCLPCSGDEYSASIWSNSNEVILPLERVVSKAHAMFAEKAYLHHYAKHGLSEEAFHHCFLTLEQQLAGYSTLNTSGL